MIFEDRYDAALKLIPFLEKYKNERGVVLAVPRGGVPIGYYIAKNFDLPLEILLTKKIGHPWNEEVAVGAVSLEGYVIDKSINLPEAYLKSEISRIMESLKERYKKFMGERKPIDVENKVVIIVDDGVATGNTLIAAIQLIREKHPKKIVVAVPVAPSYTAQKLKTIVDDFICLHVSDEFYGVGQFYRDFSQVSDEEVMHLLSDANHFENIA